MLQEYPLIDGSTDTPVALAEVGESARDGSILHEDLKKFPADTLWQYVYGPEIEAAISLSRSKPEEAVKALRRAAP
jgi:hypothetical protein